MPALSTLRSLRPILSTFAFTVFAVSTCAADTYLLEFANVVSDNVVAGNGPGGTWNVYSASSGVNGGTLLNSLGAPSSITLGYTGTLNASGNAGRSLTYDNTSAIGNPSWVATPTNNAAAGDLFFTDNGAGAVGQVVFTLQGFTPGNLLSLDILGSRNVTNADGFYEYSLDGGTSYFGLSMMNPDGSPTLVDGWSTENSKTKAYDNQTDGYNNHRYLNISEVALLSSGLRIRITDVDATSGNFAAINAMRVTVVPEPSSVLLMGAAGLVFLRRRRSQQ